MAAYRPAVAPSEPVLHRRTPGQGGESRICRICEISEFDQETADGHGTWLLVAEICPTSQTVTPILENIANSEFFGESHLETRRRAYRRERQAFWEGSHDLRNCRCAYCTQDRRTFRDALDPLLTKEESEILDISDRLEPLITTALQEASADMMEAWARKLGMIGEQVLSLREHIRGCPNSTSELTRKSRTIESDFAYLLFALETRTETPISPSRRFLNADYRRTIWLLKRITYTIIPHKTGIRLLGVARNPANGFPARPLVLQRRV